MSQPSDDKKEMELPKVVSLRLSPREERAMSLHLAAREPPLGTSLQLQFFEMYLQGVTLEEIVRANRGVKLGALVRAAVEGGWYQRREDHIKQLLDTVKNRAGQMHLEGVNFISNLLAVAHKRHGAKLLRYLQTGDEKDLGAFSIETVSAYKTIAELLLKLTGQDKKPPPPPPDTKDVGGREVTQAPSSLPPRPPTPQEAAEILAALQPVSTVSDDEDD